MKKTMLFTVLGAFVMMWMGWGMYIIYTTERPAYTVTQLLAPDVEVRQYEEQTWISTTYDSDDNSFPVLASYIFGRNQEQETVAMTAPVITDEKMSFILPAGVSADTAPTPDGQAIAFTTVPARKVATLSFSWYTPEQRVAKKTEALMEILSMNDIEIKGRPFLMRYNDLWTPPFWRRNEIGVEVE